MENSELLVQLKQMVIESCRVKNCTPADITDSEPIIGGKNHLKLDSLDAVEIAMALERKFGIKIESPGDARKMLKSFSSLADFVQKNKLN